MSSVKVKNILSSKKLRVTKTRIDILTLFMNLNYALTHSEIKESLSGKYDEVTIYRTINIFEEKGIIHKIPDNSKMASFALNKEFKSGECSGDTHIHFHCNGCGHNFCLTVDDKFKISFPDNLSVSFVNILADGLCEKCKAKEKD